MASKNATIYLNAKNRTKQGFRQARGEAKSFQRGMKKIALGIAGYFSARAAIGYTRQLVDSLDELGKTAKRIGTSAEAYQELGFAARRAGATTGDVERGFKRMASTIYDSEQGMAESVRALDALGLSWQQLKGLAPEKQFSLIADALNNVDDATTKAALAQDVFGRAGTQLIPMLAEYRDTTAEIRAMGGIISQENIEAAESFKDSMESIKTSTTAMAANSGFISWLDDVAQGMTEIIKAQARSDMVHNKTSGGGLLGRILLAPFAVKKGMTNDDHFIMRGPSRAEIDAPRNRGMAAGTPGGAGMAGLAINMAVAAARATAKEQARRAGDRPGDADRDGDTAGRGAAGCCTGCAAGGQHICALHQPLRRDAGTPDHARQPDHDSSADNHGLSARHPRRHPAAG